VTRTLLFSAAIALALPAAAFAQTKPAAPAAQAPQSMSKADFLKQVDARFAAIDTNHDGSVTKDEVAAMQAKALAEAQAAEQKSIEADFKKLDTNKDNSLSLAEFKAAAPSLRPRQTPDQMLAELDSNKDGKVTAAEYRSNPVASFDKADANHDGTLTAQELAASRKR
jgi:Ca2+-binding EF-hand superfamily protein